ncbi:GGDEF domain-containing protein [Psychromonas sp. 14N.309.X.WAT.B.A12]|uniref:GGDEF domain-containing protein n=1 Tax=Psychromonas sp. 14N.309.X.WAT.B.A12 TaxID=2998322 RepID=UPI0025B12062|nr:GGDEF domain-containing protein [Psychromonas sp. 14N.309.X.WAT.B.A12]MDN2663010.1 GGDEF domain-containing protein [Psychromonas sp. 14N.309.X.WAT.B.A12]
MFSRFYSIMNVGIQDEPPSKVEKMRMLNVLNLLTLLVSFVYTANYVFVLKEDCAALYNVMLTGGYVLVFLLSYFHCHKVAKITYFSFVLLHLFFFTNLFFTKDSGFHFYYFLVPMGVLLLFELKEISLKIVFSIAAALLFLYSENTLNPNPLVVLNSETNHILYQSVFLVNMFAIVLALTLFSKQIEKHELELVKQATTDILTGIKNRRCFFEEGEQLLIEANKAKQHVTLLLLDLDFFKSINDKYGHSVGDDCLVGVASTLQRLDFKDKVCARIGGEEFALLLPNCSLQRGMLIADKLRVQIEHLVITNKKGNVVKCTTSIGVSCNITQQENLKALLEKSDIALYEAKGNGRNRVASYSEHG